VNTIQHTNRNDFSSIHAQINHLIGGEWGQIPATTHPYSKTTTLSSKHAGELKRQAPVSSPRMWNETLAFAAEG
jgi:hypothetical protein